MHFFAKEQNMTAVLRKKVIRGGNIPTMSSSLRFLYSETSSHTCHYPGISI